MLLTNEECLEEATLGFHQQINSAGKMPFKDCG